MSKHKRKKKQDSKEQPLAGERLAAVRRERDIPIRDVARELHLDESKVEALEENRFESLGAPVFAKGHLRKYAEIVGVPVDEVLHDYDEMNRSAGAPPVVAEPRNVPRDIDLTRYILPALVAVLVVGSILGWLLLGSPVPETDQTASTPASRVEIDDSAADSSALPREIATPVESTQLDDDTVAANDEPTAEPVAGSGESSMVESSPEPDADVETMAAQPESQPVREPEPGPEPASESTADLEPAPEPQPEPPASPLAGPQVRLTMTFTGDCWTEVTDADGERLYFDLGRDGRSINVSGSAPLRVLFGSYANVSVAVDGEPYDIPRSALRGDTARFTIDAP